MVWVVQTGAKHALNHLDDTKRFLQQFSVIYFNEREKNAIYGFYWYQVSRPYKDMH